MLFKKKDAWARSTADYDVITALPDSVIAKPLGLLEERSAKSAGAVTRSASDDALAQLAFENAPSAELPAGLKPQLATLATELPTRGQWAYEIKFDGYRIVARIEKGTARLFTRNGHDWTDKMASLAKAIASLDMASGWLDGEVVVIGDDGLPSFNGLQNAFDKTGTESIQCFAFDLPYLDGKDLQRLPLAHRRALLRARLESNTSERIRSAKHSAATARAS